MAIIEPRVSSTPTQILRGVGLKASQGRCCSFFAPFDGKRLQGDKVGGTKILLGTGDLSSQLWEARKPETVHEAAEWLSKKVKKTV